MTGKMEKVEGSLLSSGGMAGELAMSGPLLAVVVVGKDTGWWLVTGGCASAMLVFTAFGGETKAAARAPWAWA